MQYWQEHFNSDEIVGSDDLQRNVGRTEAGISIDANSWNKSIEYIRSLILPKDKNCSLLELCCGNGMVIGNLADSCERAVGVDFSSKLLEQLIETFGSKVEVQQANILDVHFTANSFDAVVIQSSLQYFTEKETVELVERILSWLKPGGKILLGDIPDASKKWDYISKPEYQKDYIQRVIDDKPMIGYWYRSEFFNALNHYFHNCQIEAFSKPKGFFNSDFRFDVVISKF